MLNVKNRSQESWGPLASVDDQLFNQILDNRRSNTKELIKTEVKKIKKLKTYKVSFRKEWVSDQYEIKAESEYDLSMKAREFFKNNADSIGFKERSQGKWVTDYKGYDSFSYVKVRS
jgi:hypothetical protein